MVWEKEIPGMGLSLPSFSSEGRRISAPFRGADTRTGIVVLDTETGDEHIVAMLPFALVRRRSKGLAHVPGRKLVQTTGEGHERSGRVTTV